jgi:hypothetical protein
VRIHVNFKIGSKWGSPFALRNVFNQHVFHYSQNLSSKDKRKQWKKAKKKVTLNPRLHFGSQNQSVTMSSPLSFFFYSPDQLNFSPK